MNIQKEKNAIAILQQFSPPDDSYYLCYSGGKDSDCIRILASLAGVPHEIHHNLTTMDAPETVAYVKSIPNVIIDKSYYSDGSPKTIWNLIPRKKLPPTRLMRYCCSELKENGGKGRLKVTGVRWDESVNRRRNGNVVKIIGKEKTTQKQLSQLGLDFQINPKGGILMSYDNETARDKADFTHVCYKDRTTTINPIIDWSDSDVWEFLRHYGCKPNPLYYCGNTRVGCVGCPMGGFKQMQKEFLKYPKFASSYIRAFDRMLLVRKQSGLGNKLNWQSGVDVFRWWIHDDTDINQLSFDFDDEELDILWSIDKKV